MPKTVEQGFNEFLSRLTPSAVESDAAKRHRRSIKNCLSSKLWVSRFFRTGSFGNGTSICGYSDVDYFAVTNMWRTYFTSSTVLRSFKKTLKRRFPKTQVKQSSPAVVISFGKDHSEITEIVPAIDTGKIKKGYHIYAMPDGKGQWMKTSPRAHNEWITQLNKKVGRKLKPLIRFVKAWKYYRNIPISSFYIEVQVSKYAQDKDSINYSVDLRNILDIMLKRQLKTMRDPTGVTGYIYPCYTSAKKNAVLPKLHTASIQAEKAIVAEESGDILKAFNDWNRLYNGNFPSYQRGG
ncbi:MAG: nucleotidyltransferase [Candidatus Bathyarchaeota archaeon]